MPSAILPATSARGQHGSPSQSDPAPIPGVVVLRDVGIKSHGHHNRAGWLAETGLHALGIDRQEGSGLPPREKADSFIARTRRDRKLARFLSR